VTPHVVGVGQFWFPAQAVTPIMAVPNQYGVMNMQPQVVFTGTFQAVPAPQPYLGSNPNPNGWYPQHAPVGFVANGMNGGY